MTTTYSTRLQLPRPGLDDLADGPDAFNRLTDKLDPSTAIFTQGTLAARPAAGVAGRFYWATDTRTLHYDDGAAWQGASAPLAVASALPVLDVGISGQIRAGRQLAVADFTALGLSQPIGLFNLSDLTNLGSDGRALANRGAVPFGVGINGAAATSAVFAGSTSQGLYIADSGAADPYRIRAGTWGAWMRTAKRGTWQAVMSKDAVAPGRGWDISCDTTNVATAEMSSDGTTVLAVRGTTDIADDRWHFIVATVDGAGCRVYVDGVLEGSANVTGVILATAGPLNVGAQRVDASASALSPHYGRVDEAFVTGDVLSEDQVRALYCARIAHGLGVAPTRVSLNVRRRRKGGPYVVGDFTTQPLRLYNLTNAYVDLGSNNVLLTPNVGWAWVAGANGKYVGAASFAGDGGNFSGTDAGLPAALTTRSFGCWFKAATPPAGTSSMVSWGTLTTGDARVGLTSAGALRTASGADVLDVGVVTDGAWHLVVVVEDNTAGDGVRRKLYLDGRLVGGSTVLNSVVLAGANRFRVGCHPDGTGGFNGQIDEVFVCGYALDAGQIATLYAKGALALPPSPKNPGDHIEGMDTTSLLATFDTLDSQHTIDLGVMA